MKSFKHFSCVFVLDMRRSIILAFFTAENHVALLMKRMYFWRHICHSGSVSAHLCVEIYCRAGSLYGCVREYVWEKSLLRWPWKEFSDLLVHKSTMKVGKSKWQSDRVCVYRCVWSPARSFALWHWIFNVVITHTVTFKYRGDWDNSVQLFKEKQFFANLITRKRKKKLLKSP